MAISPSKKSRGRPMPDEGLLLELRVRDGWERSSVLKEERPSCVSESHQPSKDDRALLIGQAMGRKSHKRSRASLENQTSPAVQSTRQVRGLLAQRNEKWRAQIYAKQEKIWLGTFRSQIEVALAYDRASIKLRGNDGPRNLPNEPIIETESDFQNQYTDEQIVQMIKDHSYDDKLQRMKHRFNLPISTEQGGPNLQQLGMTHEQYLFRKEMTASDVGRLSRLAIPIKHAKDHFPTYLLQNDEDKVPLTFLDRDGKEWKMMFAYWKSGSYVLSSGWSRYVRAKNLEAGDMVSFARDRTMAEFTFYITVRRSGNGGVGIV